jgi:hypothetical protein
VCVLSSLADPAFDCPAQINEVLLSAPPLVWKLDEDRLETPAERALAVPGTNIPSAPPDQSLNRVAVDPGLYRLRVLAVPSQVGAQLVALLAPGQPIPNTLMPLRYCSVPDALAQPGGSVTQLFIPAPTNPATALQAALWAQEHGTPLAPPPCDLSMVVNTTGGAGLQAVWIITVPSAGAVVTDDLPVLGTAQFNHDEVAYYKVEVHSATDTSDTWAYVGGGPEPVVDGVLATLPGDRLPPGPYLLRLVIVKVDGNYPAPYVVPFTVERP